MSLVITIEPNDLKKPLGLLVPVFDFSMYFRDRKKKLILLIF